MPKVLIIEDRRENIVFVANNILKPLGHDVITAMDGQTGLIKAQEESPDLIITDLKLPKLSGLEVLEKLAQKGISIPAIVMTFHGTEETAVQAFRLGARDYLVKPFSVEEMHAALDRALKPLAGSARPAANEAKAEARAAALEQELIHMRAVLAKRESQLQQLHRQLVQHQQPDVTAVVQQAAQWERDNARLNQILARSKEILSASEGRARAMEEAIGDQKAQMAKYQREAKRLAEELRNLTEAVRLMSQDIEQQIQRLEVLSPREESVNRSGDRR
jgi:DNA-binding response OmpR family regulator